MALQPLERRYVFRGPKPVIAHWHLAFFERTAFPMFPSYGSSVSSTLWELTVNLCGELGVFFSHKLLPTAVSKDKVLSDDQYKAWLAAAAAGLWLLNHCGLELLLWGRSYGNAPMFRSFGMCGWIASIALLFSVLLSAQVVAGMETAVEAAAAESHTGSSTTDPGEWRTRICI